MHRIGGVMLAAMAIAAAILVASWQNSANAAEPAAETATPLESSGSDFSRPIGESVIRQAEAGDAQAQYELAVAHAHGAGVAQDFGEARRLYRLAAEQGHAGAQFTLADALFFGELEIERDTDEALRWYLAAANQNHSGAQAQLGFMYAGGEGVEADAAEALRWTALAAEQGEAVAQYNLGTAYLTGDLVDQDFSEAIRLLQLAAGQGLAEAQYSIGVMYEFADGVDQDFAIAANYYRLASEQDYARASGRLGRLYAGGLGVERDYAQALRHYEAGIAQADGTSLSGKAELFLYGLGVPEDPEFAYALTFYAIAASDAHGMYLAGFMREIGIGIEANIDDAIGQYQRAGEFGHRTAPLRLAMLYLEGKAGTDEDRTRALTRLTVMAGDDPQAAYLLGEVYARGLGVDPDATAAQRWYLSAAERGHADAQYRIGLYAAP